MAWNLPLELCIIAILCYHDLFGFKPKHYQASDIIMSECKKKDVVDDDAIVLLTKKNDCAIKHVSKTMRKLNNFFYVAR